MLRLPHLVLSTASVKQTHFKFSMEIMRIHKSKCYFRFRKCREIFNQKLDFVAVDDRAREREIKRASDAYIESELGKPENPNRNFPLIFWLNVQCAMNIIHLSQSILK